MTRFAAFASVALFALACGSSRANSDTGQPPDNGALDAEPALDVGPEAATDHVAEPLPDTPLDLPEPTPDDISFDVAPDAPTDAPLFAWTEPAVWSEPLKDYIEHVLATIPKMKPQWFDHSVKELTVWEGRMYMGYGDWTANTGPVEARYFDPVTDEMTKEFVVDEESIDYYRIFGSTMFIPGVDAKEDAFLGNVFYKKQGQPWVKVRKLEHGVHVLDVIEFEGKLFACGGGISNFDDYNKGISNGEERK